MKEKRFGKKQAVLCLMVLLLGASVYLNYYVASKTPTVTDAPAASDDAQTSQTTHALGESQFVSNTTAAPTEDYFEAARRSREEARQEALDILKDTLQDVKVDAVTQQDALAVAATVASAVEQEDAIESLIKARGFEDCVVYIENGQCHVAVKAAQLQEAQTLQIVQIVTAQSDVEASDINIVTVE